MGVLIPINSLKPGLLKKPFSQKFGYLLPCLRLGLMPLVRPRWGSPQFLDRYPHKEGSRRTPKTTISRDRQSIAFTPQGCHARPTEPIQVIFFLVLNGDRQILQVISLIVEFNFGQIRLDWWKHLSFPGFL